MKIETTAYDLAQRFVGVSEVSGSLHNPQIMAMLKLDTAWPEGDEVPWCSAFANYVAWLLRLPRSKSLAARSWLTVGRPILLHQAEPENDVVIFSRGAGAPGPEVLNAPGHVGFFAGNRQNEVLVLGGNQGDTVGVSHYRVHSVLGVRRLL
jgi:uncharacterized protein (TIGR02594 family)